ncbi:MAG: hypothetical protein MUC96_31790 [Myxococcaceae bacterium]|jgi:hypothetical protein|nr:hypothetical protein [Myxococcaceae bacterium]
MRTLISLTTFVALAACGTPESATANDTGGGSAGGVVTGQAGGAAGGSASSTVDAGAEPLPTTRDAIVSFAQRRAYAPWPAEAAPHLSTGPHGGRVRTWVNPVLAESLEAGNTSHPIGSIAVKELYGSGTGTTITGWAVDVKDVDGTWVFFEGFTPALNQFFFRGTGNLCSNCHRAGVDQVLTPPSALP